MAKASPNQRNRIPDFILIGIMLAIIGYLVYFFYLYNSIFSRELVKFDFPDNDWFKAKDVKIFNFFRGSYALTNDELTYDINYENIRSDGYLVRPHLGGSGPVSPADIIAIDASTCETKSTIHVGTYPYGIAINPSNNKMYVISTNPEARYVSQAYVVDGLTNNLARVVDLGNFSGAFVDVNPLTNTVYITGHHFAERPVENVGCCEKVAIDSKILIINGLTDVLVPEFRGLIAVAAGIAIAVLIPFAMSRRLSRR